MAKKKFTIQIEQSIMVTREITADDMGEALEKAEIFARDTMLVKPVNRSWTDGWGIPGLSKVIGIFE